MTKKRFIAGAVCPKCQAQDSIVLLMSDLEKIECVVCGYSELRPTAAQLAAMQTPDEVGVVQFKPNPKLNHF